MAEQPIVTPPTLAAVLAEADRIEEDTLYSAKGQWESARPWEFAHFAIGIPATVAAAAAGVSIVSQWEAVAGCLAFLSAVLTGLLTFLNPEGRAAAHRQAGNAYKAVSNDARIFRTVACSDAAAVRKLRRTLVRLNRRRNTLNETSPPPSRRAFKRARKGIEDGEATYRADSQSSRRDTDPALTDDRHDR
ncbi:MAG: SLATT domain-containing protein [Phycisphaerales bacterium]